MTTTLAPASSSAFNVGTDAVMRPASVMLPVVVERHVQVGAHQHAATRNTLRQKVVEGRDGHG